MICCSLPQGRVQTIGQDSSGYRPAPVHTKGWPGL